MKETVSASGVTLAVNHAGKIVATQNSGWPAFPENLPNGFTCTIVNYSNATYTSNSLSTAMFFHNVLGWNGGAGDPTFSIKSGGTVKVTVIDIGASKCYFITGDIL